MGVFRKKPRVVIIFAAALWLIPQATQASSCCGGGSSSGMVLSKLAKAQARISADWENYDGYMDQSGIHRDDPPGSDLNQYRLTTDVGYRFGANWQGSVSIPYVWNSNRYSGIQSETNGIGDTSFAFKYETSNRISCLTALEKWQDLMPMIYLGGGLTMPTGISPYDEVDSSFDITGRGFYRLEANIFIEKTIFPWSTSLDVSYGYHPERKVNREYGTFVEPYKKQLGDRVNAAFSLGYIYDLPWHGLALTSSASFTSLWEDKARNNGIEDRNSGFRKNSAGLSFSLTTYSNKWVFALSWAHTLQDKNLGRNFPTTDVYSLGVTHVFF